MMEDCRGVCVCVCITLIPTKLDQHLRGLCKDATVVRRGVNACPESQQREILFLGFALMRSAKVLTLPRIAFGLWSP